MKQLVLAMRFFKEKVYDRLIYWKLLLTYLQHILNTNSLSNRLSKFTWKIEESIVFDQNDLTENDAGDEIFREVLEPLYL